MDLLGGHQPESECPWTAAEEGHVHNQILALAKIPPAELTFCGTLFFLVGVQYVALETPAGASGHHGLIC